MAGMRRWVPPAVVGGLLAWTALVTPLSVGIGEYFAYYGPQSDPERLEYHRDLAAHVYTAGHWFGHLVAAFAGVWLVTHAGAYRRAALVRAALAGGALGVVVATVGVASGVRAVRTNGYPSVAPDPTMLSEPSVRWCLLASYACFPLWALTGAAVATLRSNGRLLSAAVTILFQPATFMLWVGWFAPPSSHPFALSLIADDGPRALALPAILLAWTTVATAAAIIVSRRRRTGQAPFSRS